ncbi:PREDICTED: F-box/LRR-repeat protein At3g26922-like [Erythranthe guttata]|uniref:F-box/LRR-repeat protein At3g26922-like n=1 Tax=Erythranthe guttata TaxID=4155 RepID=UPI00064DC266|nr:PREDICTED: F-box/LRR-repeat protein At3g26922-like [Erythranthe guttata]|eukprot:XP_012842177.1 PREDICTED: F-box/LRR-repeat protein At3g26922-like [Erythranthe guttata]
MAEKRVAKFQTKKCAKIVYGDDDRITHLPDDILVDILSLLSLKEAVCTSVLSSRWHNLWKQIYRLNFDPHSSLQKRTKQGFESCKEKREKYVKWVNCVLRKHKAAILKDFIIRLRLSKTFQKDVTRWIKFAIVRHVQRLELDLTTGDSSLINCSLPQELLTRNTSSEIDLKFKSLRVLCLKSVDVTEEDIKFFQSKCPMLEELVVDRSLELLNVEACGGPSLVLKHLELTRCYNLKSVKVSAPNLTLLSIHGSHSCLKSVKISAPNLTSLTVQKVESLFLENVPRLVEVSICRVYSDVSAKDVFSAFACCDFQLEILTLEIKPFEVRR